MKEIAIAPIRISVTLPRVKSIERLNFLTRFGMPGGGRPMVTGPKGEALVERHAVHRVHYDE